jgi:uncharacterized protein YndB with AHSA1/START domain
VTYELTEHGSGTTLTLAQYGNASQEAADRMVKNGWGPMLSALKEILKQ